MEISEAREVRVRQGEASYVFLADHATGRLVIREDGGEDVCALTVGDRDELNAFLTGLRRVLGVDTPTGSGAEQVPSGAAERREDRQDAVERARSGASVEGQDRQDAVERARRRDPAAFQPWSREEEERLSDAFRRGTPVDQLARDHERSRRAIEMRLEKLGLR